MSDGGPRSVFLYDVLAGTYTPLPTDTHVVFEIESEDERVVLSVECCLTQAKDAVEVRTVDGGLVLQARASNVMEVRADGHGRPRRDTT